MSFSFALVDGDLAIQGSSLQLVSGVDLLKQNLDLWLRERFGIDRFHPTMGSTLEDFIGGVVSNNTKVAILKECERVLDNFQMVQDRDLSQAPSKFSLSELLWSINDIQVQVTYDLVTVTLSVSNAIGQSASLNASVSTL